jgi:hypothetical protein
MRRYWRADASRLIPSINVDQFTIEMGTAESEAQFNLLPVRLRVLEDCGQFLGED